MSFLIMTKQQADEVRGETIPYHCIMPIELADGTWTVNANVLTDPAHEGKRALLEILPRVETVTPKVVPDEE